MEGMSRDVQKREDGSGREENKKITERKSKGLK